jgi:hypothetical protein
MLVIKKERASTQQQTSQTTQSGAVAKGSHNAVPHNATVTKEHKRESIQGLKLALDLGSQQSSRRQLRQDSC